MVHKIMSFAKSCLAAVGVLAILLIAGSKYGLSTVEGSAEAAPSTYSALSAQPNSSAIQVGYVEGAIYSLPVEKVLLSKDGQSVARSAYPAFVPYAKTQLDRLSKSLVNGELQAAVMPASYNVVYDLKENPHLKVVAVTSQTMGGEPRSLLVINELSVTPSKIPTMLSLLKVLQRASDDVTEAEVSTIDELRSAGATTLAQYTESLVYNYGLWIPLGLEDTLTAMCRGVSCDRTTSSVDPKYLNTMYLEKIPDRI